MKYLFIFEDGTTKQSSEEISEEDLQEIDQGTLDIFRFEPERGFCRAIVTLAEAEGEDEQDEWSIADWERVELITA